MTLRRAHDEAYAEVERLADSSAKTIRKRFLELLNNPKERDADLWKAAGAQIAMTFDELALIPSANAGKDWADALEGVIATSIMQAKAEHGIIVDIMAASMRHSKSIEAIVREMSTNDIKTVAMEGINAKS
ncbi:MAG: hypothetical protein WC455_18420 [Dehalococcoidia bacterium]|jgi:hypothetical protein